MSNPKYAAMTKKELTDLLDAALQENKLLKKETGRTIKDAVEYPYLAVSVLNDGPKSMYIEIMYDLESKSAAVTKVVEHMNQHHMSSYSARTTLIMQIDKQEVKK